MTRQSTDPCPPRKLMTIPNETDEHRMFRKTARDFVEKELAPHAD